MLRFINCKHNFYSTNENLTLFTSHSKLSITHISNTVTMIAPRKQQESCPLTSQPTLQLAWQHTSDITLTLQYGSPCWREQLCCLKFNCFSSEFTAHPGHSNIEDKITSSSITYCNTELRPTEWPCPDMTPFRPVRQPFHNITFSNNTPNDIDSELKEFAAFWQLPVALAITALLLNRSSYWKSSLRELKDQ